MSNTVIAKRAPKHNAHVAARNAFIKAEAAALAAAILEDAPAENELATLEIEAAAELDLTPFDIDAFAIPGENPVTLTDEEFEIAMRSLEAQDEDAQDAGDEPDVRDFAARLADVSDEMANAMVWDIANRMDDRLARAISDAPVKIKNLNRARSKMVTGRVSRVLCAAGALDAGFINRPWRDGSEFNVYALLKLHDLAAGLVGGVIANAVNVAVVKSMFALQKAGLPYDFDTAKAAASSSHAPQRPGVRQHLTRHTVAKGTASTQAGSTMHALMALGVVHFLPSKNPTYTILENATTEALRNANFCAEDGDEA